MLNQSHADLGIPDESRLLELGISVCKWILDASNKHFLVITGETYNVAAPRFELDQKLQNRSAVLAPVYVVTEEDKAMSG